MNAGKSYLGSSLLGAGLLFVFAGERIVNPGTPRLATSAIGLLLVLVALALRVMRQSAAPADRRAVERALVGLTCVVLAALALYFAQSDAFGKLGGKTLDQSWPRLAGSLAALWPALLTLAAIPIVLIELAYASMVRAPQVEEGRVRDAMLTGLGLACALVLCFALMYVVSERDVKWDLSYFRTAKPGEATRKIARALDEPVQVSLFFPPANEVAELVSDYFDDVKKDAPKLEVKRYDQAIDPVKAREMSVSANGAVVLARGSRREQINLGTELEKARSQLRNLDQEVQKRLLTLARAKKTVYFVAGHGERTETVTGEERRTPISTLKTEMRAQNYELRPLSAAEGLGSEVPKDAAAVVLLGPTSALQAPEVASLKAYFNRGGRMLLALDPESGLDFKDLLAGLGLSFSPKSLANDVAFARKNNQPSDMTIIGTNAYSSHPAVTSLGRAGFPMYFLGAGRLDELPAHPAELVIDFAVRSHPQTWEDGNGNFAFDTGEVRKEYNLVAAVTQRSKPTIKAEEEGRAIVLGDSDALADEVLQASRGNGFFAIDSLKWLLGDEAISGATNVEQDIVITRTRTQDVYVFYGTLFLAPAAVVLAGYLGSRRRGRTRARPVSAKEGSR